MEILLIVFLSGGLYVVLSQIFHPFVECLTPEEWLQRYGGNSELWVSLVLPCGDVCLFGIGEDEKANQFFDGLIDAVLDGDGVVEECYNQWHEQI